MSEIYGSITSWPSGQASAVRHVAHWLFPGARLWFAIVIIFAVDAIWLASNDRVSADPLLIAQCVAGLTIALIVAVAAAALRGSEIHVSCKYAALMTSLFALAAWPALLILNHLVMSVKMPLADEMLIAADRSIGFNWLAYAGFIAHHPLLTAVMHLAYRGIHVAIAVCFLFHIATAQNHRNTELSGLLVVTGIGGSVIGIFFPAIAAMTVLGTAELARQLPPLAGRAFVEPLLAMRSADALMLTHANLTGITALPSYHVTLGALCVYACRGKWWMWCPMSAYAAVMIASTPIFGGHYLTDIASGLLFTGVMIWAWRSYLADWLAPEPMRFQASRPAIL